MAHTRVKGPSGLRFLQNVNRISTLVRLLVNPSRLAFVSNDPITAPVDLFFKLPHIRESRADQRLHGHHLSTLPNAPYVSVLPKHHSHFHSTAHVPYLRFHPHTFLRRLCPDRVKKSLGLTLSPNSKSLIHRQVLRRRLLGRELHHPTRLNWGM